ncbi:MAG TPA: sigma 54-interacting transcriptional regulator [Candidatus Paceibacterota bacterium]|nr:sigma 54-interacting transcriptional regulator [Verrucomicrobiota bacterium]HOX04403.1 sigma 54-interacting transcriptional regulator [Verrucomicrobiota bacterium]HRZ43973.1 sigma 54-interacting transcriptional regulator [Candidatus Paceibacterota bacterium]
MKPKILVVEDEEDARLQMKWALGEEYDVLLAADRASAVEVFRENRPEMALLDLGLPPSPAQPTEGLALMADMLNLDRLAKVIVITGHSDRATALRAVGEGAHDFVSKPIEIDDLKRRLQRCHFLSALEREYLRIHHQDTEEDLEGMLGDCRGMRNVFSAVRKVSMTDAPVLILGESGTGKRTTALAIHKHSPRQNRPFMEVNCTAIPSDALEIELFGLESTGLPGSTPSRLGQIEMANGGTLLLKELNELSPVLQVKLLRLLQRQQIERVRGSGSVAIDVRIIATASGDLAAAAAEGRFRHDLFFHLAVVVIRIPPLRERGSDIRMLAQHFLEHYATQYGRRKLHFDVAALCALDTCHWPGNVRELKNRIRRGVIMAEDDSIRLADLELAAEDADSPVNTLKDARQAAERQAILHMLRKHAGNVSSAASELGVSRTTFYNLIDKLGIDRGTTKG